ncbi:MAG: FAD-dependent oxidoreductase [Candidatus Helarchaeota archaeon]
MQRLKEKYDLIIIGGGTAGLTAALGAIDAESNCRVLLLEKNNELGKKIRGELIYDDEEILEIIFEQGIPLHLINLHLEKARYYSPSTLNYYEKNYSGKKISVDYRLLIQELAKKFIKKGGKIALNVEVIDFLKTNNKVSGVKCKFNNNEYVIQSKGIISADGARSNLRRILNLEGPKCVHTLIKTIAENVNLINKNELEFFLTINPPGVLWIFPRSKDSAEIGFTIFYDQVIDKKFDLEKLFIYYLENHPIFSERLQNASFIYHKTDYLPFCGPEYNNFIPNVMFIGDCMGQVGAVGGSGIISSMSIGYVVGNIIANNMNDLGMEIFQDLNQKIKKSNPGKFLKKEKKMAQLMRNLLYKSLGSSKKIDENWNKIKILMASRE